MKKLGIIGGMGPLATAVFFRKVVEKTPAEKDQQHIETIIVSDPIIPGRVDYILGRGCYCILNMHEDYLQESFVGDHWEKDWTQDQYRDYVTRRFQAIWKQIADYFRGYPDTLIFEAANKNGIEHYRKIWCCKIDTMILSRNKTIHDFLNCRTCNLETI